jgi:hypothetical protein
MAATDYSNETTDARRAQDIADFEARFEELLGLEQSIHDNKRKRYTGGRDPLENYTQTSEWIAKMLEVRFPDAAAFVRSRGALFAMVAREAEKFQRLITMIGQDDMFDPAQGEDESFTDTAIDVSVIIKLVDIEVHRLRQRASLARGLEDRKAGRTVPLATIALE